jgi:hypothetical protein
MDLLIVALSLATALSGAPLADASVARSFDRIPDAVHTPALTPTRGRIAPATRFTAGRVAFPVTVDGRAISFGIHSLLVLPGSTVLLEAPGATLEFESGSVSPRGAGRWAWEAPATPGVVPLRVVRDGSVVELVAFVLHPRPRGPMATLGSYRIGEYRETPLRGRAEYLPPEGFIEVRPADEDIRVSPHVTLGEILCKQPGDPRFATFTPDLLEKLEWVLEELNASGHDVGALTIMSGFRTPWYNRSIGNTTDYSRHLWGDAADVFIDRDGNGEMDDLTGDGRVDVADARVLVGIVERARARSDGRFRPGGLSAYRRNAVRGPFVHVDARGEPARW